MSPTSAARGIIEIYAVANTIRSIKNTAAEIHDILPLPPFQILIIDCQIIAHHHIAPKNQHVAFAIPCPIDSLLLFHLVSVISSMRLKVIRDSVRPIIARIRA